MTKKNSTNGLKAVFAKKGVTPVLRTPYTPRLRVTRGDFEPSLTKQAFAEEVNVNAIMARFTNTGLLSHVSNRQPRYIEHTGADFREALETLRQSETAFSELSSDVRARFNNNPAELLDFISDVNNGPEAAKLGLMHSDYQIPQKAPTEQIQQPDTPAEQGSAASAEPSST